MVKLLSPSFVYFIYVYLLSNLSDGKIIIFYIIIEIILFKYIIELKGVRRL